jgi:hypothetical protein
VYSAALVPVVGIERATLFFSRLMELRGAPTALDTVQVNGA